MELYVILTASVIMGLLWIRIEVVLCARIKETDLMMKRLHLCTKERLERLEDNTHLSMLTDLRKWKHSDFFPLVNNK